MSSRRNAKGAQPQSMTSSVTSVPSTPANNNTKRFLILTYRVEYDRVHYPLPLALEEAPSCASLQRVIRRLRRVRRLLTPCLNCSCGSDDSDGDSDGGGNAMTVVYAWCAVLQELSRQREIAARAATSLDDSKGSDMLRAAQEEIAALKERIVESAEQRAGRVHARVSA